MGYRPLSTATNIESRRRIKARRQSRRGNRLLELWTDSDGKCEFCGVQTVLVRAVDAVKIKAFSVLHRVGDIVVESPFATLEHRHPIGEGGGNARMNQAHACAKCNHLRNMQRQPQVKHHFCKRCGKDKSSSRRRHCKECRELLTKWFKPEPFGTRLQDVLREAGIAATRNETNTSRKWG